MYRRLTLILFLIFTSTYGQAGHTGLTISGNLKVIFGLSLQIPNKATIELLPNHKIATTDSLGNFQFGGLSSGTYKLRVLDYNFKPEEFRVELKTESITELKIIVNADCEVNKKIAESDIKNGKPRLLLCGGIAPVFYSDQSKTEKKYKFEYLDFGCASPPTECIIQYNQVIFDYFDKTYGRQWRRQVRKDIVGLK